MITYYTAVMVLVWISLISLIILVRNNGRIEVNDKWIFYFAYILIASAGFAEWVGVQMSGNPDIKPWMLIAAKCEDYILTPAAGAVLVGQINDSNPMRTKFHKALMIVIGLNAVFQVVSIFFGWMIVIDENNVYHHGPLYVVYIFIYLIVFSLVIIEFALYGSKFRSQNRTSLYAIMFLVVVSIFLQEFYGGNIRTAYLGITLGAILMFIHFSEFNQIVTDDKLLEQRHELMYDSLTGAYSRYAYTILLGEFEAMKAAPKNLAVIMADINGLKMVNDELGHASGDELIKGAFSCIDEVFKNLGRCYRTGGDEFVILSYLEKRKVKDSIRMLNRIIGEWEGKKVKEMSVSVGFVMSDDFKDMTVEALVREADKAMYVEKEKYYKRMGSNKRRG